MNKGVAHRFRHLLTFGIIILLLFSLSACDVLQAVTTTESIAPVLKTASTLVSTQLPTPSPTEKPTPLPTPPPTPTPEPPIYGSENSYGALPNLVISGNWLYYINVDEKIIYRLELDGSKRTAMLTKERGLALFKKIQKNAVEFLPQNTLYVKGNRIYFQCQTVETVAKKGKKKFHSEYILSIDPAMMNLRVERQLYKPGDDAKFYQWYYADTETNDYYLNMKGGFRLPLSEGEWNFYKDEKGRLFKQKRDGSGKTLILEDKLLDRFTVQGGYIYFDQAHYSGILRINLDGDDLTRIGEAHNRFHGFSGFTVAGEWIYYIGENEKMEQSLHKLRIDFSEDIKIATKYWPYSFQIINDRIFYTTIKFKERSEKSVSFSVNWDLRVMNLDGTGDRAID